MAMAAILLLSSGSSAETFTARFTPDDGIFAAPGQGWLAFGKQFPAAPKVPYGLFYTRFEWADLEPSEGVYNWQGIDDAIQEAVKHQIPFAFRIMCTNYHSKNYRSTPEWVFARGVKSQEYQWHKRDYNPALPYTTKTRLTADFSDPTFIELHRNFIRALAARYDGNAAVAFIDIGSYGNWGEWHTWGLGMPNSPPEIRRLYADMYLDNFKKTDLVFMSDDEVTFAYALGDMKHPRVGLRRDGVGSEEKYRLWFTTKYRHIPELPELWRSRRIVFEWHSAFDTMRKNNWPLAKAADWILDNHCCLLSDNLNLGQIPPEEWPQIDRLARGLGARIVLTSAIISVKNSRLDITVTGANTGITPIYLPYVWEFQLGDTVLPGAADASLPPGVFTLHESFDLPAGIPAEAVLTLRLRHRDRIFMDFPLAVTQKNSQGNVILAKIRLDKPEK